MPECECVHGGVESLRRMILYVRDEAIRLQVMDVVLLLDHAEDAMMAFPPSAAAEECRCAAIRDAAALES